MKVFKSLFIVFTLLLLFLISLGIAQERVYHASELTVSQELVLISGAPIINTGFYWQEYADSYADAFKLNYTGSGNFLLNLLSDGSQVLTLTKAGDLWVKGGISGSAKIPDSDASNFLAFSWAEDDTADRTFYFKVVGANRIITLNGNPTLSDWFNQSVKTTVSPTFTGLTLSGLSDGIVKVVSGVLSGGHDHGDLGGLLDDDHPQYLLANGSRILSADWDIGDGRKIKADEIAARDGDGLKLYDDGGNGIFVKDGGNVGIGTTTFADPTLVDVKQTAASSYSAVFRGGRILITHDTTPSTGVGLQFGYNPGGNQSNFVSYDWDASAWKGIEFAASPIKFTDAGTEIMRIANGNVGIGDTNPLKKFVVSQSNNTFASKIINTNTGATAHGLWVDTQNDSDVLSFGVYTENASNPILVARSTKKVGIGTATPGTLLDVVGTGQTIRLSENELTKVSLAHSMGLGGIATVWDDDGNPKAVIRGYPFEGVQAYFTAGNFGIGTTTPENKLHVKASLNNDYAAYIYNGGGDGQGLLIKTQASSSDTQPILALNRSDGEVFRVQANGNIGIGTTGPDRNCDILDASNPQLRLTHTDGSIYAEFQTDGNGDLTIFASGDEVKIPEEIVFIPSSDQVIDAVDDTILANATIVFLDPDGDYTLTSTPTIADGTKGQILRIMCNNSEANTVTIQDQDTLANSNIQLTGVTSRGISRKDVLTLIFDGIDWVEAGYNDN